MTVSPDLIARVQQTFAARYGDGLEGTGPQYLVQAPGRVNLIGEHTDYNDGFVLPCAINFHTVVAARRRHDNHIRVVAVDFGGEEDAFDLGADIIPDPDRHWPNYIRGVVKGLVNRGYMLGGADLVVSGNVPQGAGLSSSASLEVAIGQTFKALYNLDITQQDIALNGQDAENNFVGCNCGIMDQLISACGEDGHALLIDCRSLGTQAANLPGGVSILIVNSNKKRELVDSAYNERREQCEEAAAYFQVPALRDVTTDTFNSGKHGLSEVVMRRARHIISENARTTAAAKALTAGDMSTLQQLMAQSHASMRDDFEITVTEIDTLVDIIKKTVGDRGGVRMTGGGFGGCVVALVPSDMVDHTIAAINAEYEAATGLKADIFVCSAGDGAGVLDGETTA